MRDEVGSVERSRVLRGYVALAKPELTLLSVCTAVAAAYLASLPPVSLTPLLATLFGTALVGGGAGTLNQLFERNADALMKRTERRPIPAGIVSPRTALGIGVLLTSGGIVLLAVMANLLSAGIALGTSLLYLVVYTPLKKKTPFATVLGGIPGALPTLIGWAAVRNEITSQAWALFAILFFWQMPHFLSLAWLYKKDYARAGFRMLTVVDPGGRVVRRQMLIYAIALFPAALMPTVVGLLGLPFLVGAGSATLVFIFFVYRFARDMTNSRARRVFFASVLYLPAILLLMIVEKLVREW